MIEYHVLTIFTLALFGGIAILFVLAWITNLSDDRPFNPDWVNEVRKATRLNRKPKLQRKPPLLVREIQSRGAATHYLVRRWYRNFKSIYPPLTHLDSAGVVRVITTNLQQLQPRDIHPYLDFIDGTVQWRVSVN